MSESRDKALNNALPRIQPSFLGTSQLPKRGLFASLDTQKGLRTIESLADELDGGLDCIVPLEQRALLSVREFDDLHADPADLRQAKPSGGNLPVIGSIAARHSNAWPNPKVSHQRYTVAASL